MKNYYLKRLKAIVACLALLSMPAAADNVKSPNGKIALEFRVDNGVPVYNVT